jgi:hypothetical protein
VTGSNAFNDGFERIVDENSSYYLLGYSSSNLKTDGKFRRVRVEVNRPGLVVRTRSGYFGRDTRRAAPKTTESSMPTGLQEVLQSPLPVPGLTMRVSAAAFRGRDSKAGVSVIVEARGSDLQFSEPVGRGSDSLGRGLDPPGREPDPLGRGPNPIVRRPDLQVGQAQTRISGGMRLAMLALNPDGKAVAGQSGAMSMNLTPDTHQAITRGGVRLLSRLELKPGRYQLRVAAEDSMYGFTRGVVMYDLDVPDFSKGPLSMSGIGLASAVASRMPTTGPDRTWQQAMKTLPTTERLFASSDELREYVEVYVNDKKIREIVVTTTVRSEAGLRVFNQRQTLTKDRAKNEKFVTHQVVTSIPLKGFTPGKYVLTVEAGARGQDAYPAARQVPFSVR